MEKNEFYSVPVSGHGGEGAERIEEGGRGKLEQGETNTTEMGLMSTFGETSPSQGRGRTLPGEGSTEGQITVNWGSKDHL